MATRGRCGCPSWQHARPQQGTGDATDCTPEHVAVEIKESAATAARHPLVPAASGSEQPHAPAALRHLPLGGAAVGEDNEFMTWEGLLAGYEGTFGPPWGHSTPWPRSWAPSTCPSRSGGPSRTACSGRLVIWRRQHGHAGGADRSVRAAGRQIVLGSLNRGQWMPDQIRPLLLVLLPFCGREVLL